jgi:hypothetical protein
MNLRRYFQRARRALAAGPRAATRVRPRLQALDGRDVPARVEFNPFTGQVLIVMDPYTQGVIPPITVDRVGADLRVTDGGTASVFAGGDVRSVRVIGSAAADVIHLEALPAAVPVSIEAGAGDDVINLGSGAGGNNLGSLGARITVDGGAGADALTANDQGYGGGDAYALTPGGLSVAGLPGFGLDFAGVEGTTLNTGGGNDQVSVGGMMLTHDAWLSVHTGGGDDRLDLKEWCGTPVPGGPPPVWFDGGTGSDTVAGPAGQGHWDLTGPDAGALVGVVGFKVVENLRGGSGDDRFAFGPGAGVSGVVDGGAGWDVLDYGLYGGAVSIDLQGGKATGAGWIEAVEGAVLP